MHFFTFTLDFLLTHLSRRQIKKEANVLVYIAPETSTTNYIKQL